MSLEEIFKRFCEDYEIFIIDKNMDKGNDQDED